MVQLTGDPAPRACLCFRVTKAAYLVVFADGGWAACASDYPFKPCPEARLLLGIHGVLTPSRGPKKPEAFLCGVSTSGRWTLFDELQHPPSAGELYATPRLPPLKSGDLVDCVGAVWGGIGSRIAEGRGLVFIKIAAQRVSSEGAAGQRRAGQWRRFAIVGLPGALGGKPTWAELLSEDTGLVLLDAPRSSAVPAALHLLPSLLLQVPTLLSAHPTASGVNSLLSRLDASSSTSRLRPRSAADAPAATPTATQVAGLIGAAGPAPAPAAAPPDALPANYKPGLKDAGPKTFAKWSVATARAVCLHEALGSAPFLAGSYEESQTLALALALALTLTLNLTLHHNQVPTRGFSWICSTKRRRRWRQSCWLRSVATRAGQPPIGANTQLTTRMGPLTTRAWAQRWARAEAPVRGPPQVQLSAVDDAGRA